MIRLENVTKSFSVRGLKHVVIDRLSLDIPPKASLALLGRNGAGKSTLMQLIAGSLSPDSGRIVKDCSVSWPVGFGGSFHGDLTGAQNVRFIARIYGVDTDELEYFVRDFAEIGEHFDMPVRGYSSGMKSRLAFGASMGVQFDTYLIDEVTAVGDAAFRAKSKAIIQERLESSGAIMVSHSMRQLREICTSGLVLERGHISYYADINDAIAVHETNLRRNTGAGSRDGKSGKAAR